MTPFKIQAAKVTETSGPLIEVADNWGELVPRPEYMEQDLVQIASWPEKDEGFWKQFSVDLRGKIYPGNWGDTILSPATRDALALAIGREWARIFHEGPRPGPGAIEFDSDSLIVKLPEAKEEQ